MNKKEQEKQNRHNSENQFNSVTQKGKPENQNQSHNVKKEGVNVEIRNR